MLLAVVSHQDDIAVGGPDETSEFQVILGAGGRRLHRRNLVRLNTAELRGRVQHPDAPQQTGVHLKKQSSTLYIKIVLTGSEKALLNSLVRGAYPLLLVMLLDAIRKCRL